MTPADGRARESTGARPAPDPAAERTPVARGAAPGVSLGGPSPSTVREGEGGTSSPPPAERSMDAGTPDPETGAVPLSPLGAAPVRGRDSGDEERAAQRKDWKAAVAAHSAAQRRGRGRYTRTADRATGSRYVPGGNRREPPAPESGGAA